MSGNRQEPGRVASARAQELRDIAVQHVDELAARLGRAGAPALARPCPARRKLGDGNVGTVAAHAINNYLRTGSFVEQQPEGVDRGRPPGHQGFGDVELGAMLERLAAAREALESIGRLSEAQLAAIPAAGEMRFVDGKRTLEEILASLLKHQRHEVDAISAALA